MDIGFLQPNQQNYVIGITPINSFRVLKKFLLTKTLGLVFWANTPPAPAGAKLPAQRRASLIRSIRYIRICSEILR